MKKLAVASIFLVFIGTLVAGLFLATHLNSSPNLASEPEEVLIYEVNPGLTYHSIAEDFKRGGLVRSAKFFVLMAKFRNLGSKLKVGEYRVTSRMSTADLLQTITSGKSIERPVTINEGLNIYEMAEIVEKHRLASGSKFLELVKNKEFIRSLLGENIVSLEGYLYPDTYYLTKFTDLKALISLMVKKTLQVYTEVSSAKALPGWSRHQILTLASIIEKETGAQEERPLISSVFHNRLQKRMLLQTDPTVLYGMAERAGRMVMSITREDLRTPTQYNTYVIKGLPPGPIANPGKLAIQAALSPARSEFLYFVSQNDGTHRFSEDYDSHVKAVKQFQMNPAARKGKSWRDLSKRQTTGPSAGTSTQPSKRN